MLAWLLALISFLLSLQGTAQPAETQQVGSTPVYEQLAVYDRSLDGYLAIGTPVTFTATQVQLWGDPAGTYAGVVTGYMLTSHANQDLDAGVATVDYVVSYTANGLQRTAAIPTSQVSR
jgi:hypothetical protein